MLVLAACGGGGGGSGPTEPPEPPPVITPPTQPTTPQALDNPIETSIELGEITVNAEKFVRAPKTEDVARPGGTNNPYARIQYLQQLPGTSTRLLFNDTRGFLYVTDLDGTDPQEYLNLNDQDVDFYPNRYPNESGFLGFAVHPDFEQEGAAGFGKLYTSFSATASSGEADFIEQASSVQESVVIEWSADDPSLNTFAGTKREILRIGQFQANHNIGSIAFNPNAQSGTADYGMLYIALGDGGGANDPYNHGQDVSTPLGAILRIDPLGGDGDSKYGIPSDNPDIEGEDPLGELWAYGLRHPQHFSWDSNNRMFIMDIGQDQIEEVNVGVAGGNYGWRLREGTFATAFGVSTTDDPGEVYERGEDEEEYEYPRAQYDHDEGFAVSSGLLYEGENVPELKGKFVFTELVRGRLFYIDVPDSPTEETATVLELQVRVDGTDESLVDVAGHRNQASHHAPHNVRADVRLSRDSAGELYVLTKGDGWIRKINSVN